MGTKDIGKTLLLATVPLRAERAPEHNNCLPTPPGCIFLAMYETGRHTLNIEMLPNLDLRTYASLKQMTALTGNRHVQHYERNGEH